MKFLTNKLLASLLIILICNVHIVEGFKASALENARITKTEGKKSTIQASTVSKVKNNSKIQKVTGKSERKATKVTGKSERKSTKVALLKTVKKKKVAGKSESTSKSVALFYSEVKKKFFLTTLLIIGIIIAATTLILSVGNAIYKHVYLYRKQRENLDLINKKLQEEYILKLDLCSFGKLNVAKLKREFTFHKFNFGLVYNAKIECPAKKKRKNGEAAKTKNSDSEFTDNLFNYEDSLPAKNKALKTKNSDSEFTDNLSNYEDSHPANNKALKTKNSDSEFTDNLFKHEDSLPANECEKEKIVINKLKSFGASMKNIDYIKELEESTEIYCNYKTNTELTHIANRTVETVQAQQSIGSTILSQVGLVFGLVSDCMALAIGIDAGSTLDKIKKFVLQAGKFNDALVEIDTEIINVKKEKEKSNKILRINNEGENKLQETLLETLVTLVEEISKSLKEQAHLKLFDLTNTTTIVDMLKNLLSIISSITNFYRKANNETDSIDWGIFICGLVSPSLSIVKSIMGFCKIPPRTSAMISLIFKLVLAITEVLQSYYETKEVFKNKSKMNRILSEMRTKITLEKCEQEVKVFELQEFLSDGQNDGESTDLTTIRENLYEVCKDSLRTCMEIDSLKKVDTAMAVNGELTEFFEFDFFMIIAKNILEDGPLTDIAPSLNYFNDESLIDLGYEVVDRGEGDSFINMNNILTCRNCRINTVIIWACLQYVNPHDGLDIDVDGDVEHKCDKKIDEIINKIRKRAIKKTIRINLLAKLVYWVYEHTNKDNGTSRFVTKISFSKSKNKSNDLKEYYQKYVNLPTGEDKIIIPELHVNYTQLRYTKINKIMVWHNLDNEDWIGTPHANSIHDYKLKFITKEGNTDFTPTQRKEKLQADFCEHNCDLLLRKPILEDDTCLRSFATANKVEQVMDFEKRCSLCLPVNYTNYHNNSVLDGSKFLHEAFTENNTIENGSNKYIRSRNGKFAFGYFHNEKFIYDKDEEIYIYSEKIDKKHDWKGFHYDYFYLNYKGITFINTQELLKEIKEKKNTYNQCDTKSCLDKALNSNNPPPMLTNNMNNDVLTRTKIWENPFFYNPNGNDNKAYDRLLYMGNNGIMSDIQKTNYRTKSNYPPEVEKLYVKRFISRGEFMEGDHFELTSYNDEWVVKFDDRIRRAILDRKNYCVGNTNTENIKGSRLVMKKNGLNGTRMGIYSYKGKELCKEDFDEPARIILKNDGILAVYSERNIMLLSMGRGTKIKKQ